MIYLFLHNQNKCEFVAHNLFSCEMIKYLPACIYVFIFENVHPFLFNFKTSSKRKWRKSKLFKSYFMCRFPYILKPSVTKFGRIFLSNSVVKHFRLYFFTGCFFFLQVIYYLQKSYFCAKFLPAFQRMHASSYTRLLLQIEKKNYWKLLI